MSTAPASKPLPLVVIACQIFRDILDKLLPASMADQVIYLDYGLHRVPARLKRSVQELVDGVADPSLILLGYGLCGNGLNGISAGRHILLAPRADDCIAVLLGSYQAYQREFTTAPGTYYLSKGWLESGSNPLREYQEYCQKYGLETADFLMDQQYRNYKRLAFVAHLQEDLDRYHLQVEEVAQFCQRWGMVYETILGSDAFVLRLVAMAAAIQKAGNAQGEDFVVVPPGGVITQSHFVR